ncbi:MAG: class I SAM-dependent methyltransferase [Anaerolineales bacterium]|nr:class I SAM-dependent methyltransferase [Anaerolineales bacterium]
MNLQRVKEHFDKDASDYDNHIIRFVPFYREQHAMMMDLLPFEKTARIRGLDLGAGTGVLAEGILRKYPLAEVTVFDLSDKMIGAARERLSKFAGRTAFRKGDFSKDEFGIGYDLVLSGLSIHHLSNPKKQALFRKTYLALNPGGMFLNRDVIRGTTKRLEEIYIRLWREYVRSNGEDDAAMMERYYAEDIPAGVEEQLEWMRRAGFVDVGCHWQRTNFAVYGGRKDTSEKES